MPDSGGLRGNSFWPITDTSAEPMFIKTIESFPDSFLGPWLLLLLLMLLLMLLLAGPPELSSCTSSLVFNAAGP